MYENAYTIVALGMRYLFTAMIVYILVRTARSVYREYTYERAARLGTGAWGTVEIVSAPEPFLGEVYALKQENTIGRAKRCDIFIPDKSLARVHAALYQRREGIVVSDYGSPNGVCVNSERVKRSCRLKDGDIIAMGDIVFRLRMATEDGYEH